MEKHRQILLFSGGIDSFVAYHFLGYPQTLYFNLRNQYAEKEMAVVKQLIPDTIIDDSLNLSNSEDPVTGYIPFRNLLVACRAVQYSDNIVIAGVADDRVSDKNENIFMKFSSIMSEMEGRDIRVHSPFWTMTKAEVVKWYLDKVGQRQTLFSTVSCYDPSSRYCGRCPACFRKWLALWTNNICWDFEDYGLMHRYYVEAYNWINHNRGKGLHPQRARHTLIAVRQFFDRKGIDTCPDPR